MKQLNFNMEKMCYLRGPYRDVISKVSCGTVVSREWRQDEECTLLEPVARERLVKTQQAGETSAVEISGGAVIACSSESCV
jgi:hypothetical protein